MPRSGVGNKFQLALLQNPTHGPLLHALWSSLLFDYFSRQKMCGTSMNYFTTKQLPAPPPSAFEGIPSWAHVPLADFLRSRALELTYTSHQMHAYAADIIGPEPGPPFRWVPSRRRQIIAEIEATMLHMFGLDRGDAEHVLNAFPLLRKYEERDHGEFLTKRLVLAAYDAMAEATTTGVPFVSRLDPPPGSGPRHPEVSND